MLPAARSSYDVSAIRYVLPVLWIVSFLHNREMGDAYVSSSSLGCGSGSEVCYLRLYLAFTARRVCIAQYMLRHDVCLFICYSLQAL